MHAPGSNLLNAGLYTVPDASRLTRISTGKIRRWLKGYGFKSGERIHHSDAVWQGELKPIENKLALSFRDLLELRFVDAFIRAGVSWRTMRRAHAKAQDELDTTHPFCSNRIATDGKNILLADRSGVPERARVLGSDIIWYPLGKDRQIVIDPRRNFGQPTVTKSGVPTTVLARSVKTNGSVQVVSHWFEVSEGEIRDAVEFETRLAA